MTGFGEGRAESERLEVVATLRSVNHRFLDLALRMPDECRVLEPDLAQRLRERLRRGRVELRLALKQRGPRNVEVSIDERLAARYVEASNRLAEGRGIAENLSSGDLLRLPEVVVVEAPSGVVAADDREVVEAAVARALDRLLDAREREGESLAKVLRRVLGELAQVVEQLNRSRAQLQEELQERTRKRLEELTGDLEIEDGRLAQELALLADRADIQEEIDRLEVHLDRFAALLDSDKAAGKRLDFLAQEILRELNTIGSKSRSSEAVRLVVEGKVRCEQLREQVQNVE